jgi:ubiquinone/menaquinone biosynthesis C-methylase UbiE/acyl carrier protein
VAQSRWLFSVAHERMIVEGSYDVSNFAIDVGGEIQRLNAQVDLFWSQEVALYQRLGLKDGMRLLDCGCGPGYVLEKLHALYPAMECTGIEVDEQLVAVAKRTVAEKHLDRCRIFQQSVTAMELPDDSFDFVIARLVLEHLPNPMLALKEVLRVLKTGGKGVFVANDFDLHERTAPDSPALEELYDAYRRARRSEGGNPCIGRELPLLMKRAGYSEVDLQLLAAHNHVLGDAAFLKAEGSGIPLQLIKTGHLASEALDRIAGQWRSMLSSKDHAIFRMLFAAVGEKASPLARSRMRLEGDGDERETFRDNEPLLVCWPQSAEEIRLFIQRTLAEEANMSLEALPSNESLIHLGVDSMAAVGLCNQLESRLSVTLPMSDVLSGKSIDELTEQVMALIESL